MMPDVKSHSGRVISTGLRRVKVTQVSDSRWEVALARPEKLNAIDARMRDELALVCRLAIAQNTNVSLYGEGDAFCAGGDISEFGTCTDMALAHEVRRAVGLPALFGALGERLTVAVHGHCYGAGLELAAFARWIFCEEDAHFCLPERQYGLMPGSGGTVSLVRRIGRRRTLNLYLSGEPVDAREALRIGLVDRVVKRARLLSEMRAT